MSQIRVTSDQDECRVFWNGTDWIFDFAHHETIPGYILANLYKAGYAAIFRNVPIPQGTLIHEARITFRAFGNSFNDDVNTFIQGEKNPEPLPFSNLADYVDRVRTTAFIAWDKIGPWLGTRTYSSPDIKAIIQEIINLPTWEAGKDICIFWHDHTDLSTHNDYTTRMAETHHHDPNNAPRLTIHWLEDPLCESYVIGGDSYFKLITGKVAGQTFRVQQPFMLRWIDLNLKSWKSISKPWVKIYLQDGEHHPLAEELSHSEGENYPSHWPGQTVRVRFQMTPYLLDPYDSYVMLVRQDIPLPGLPDEWQYDKDDATYPRGIRISREADDQPWDDHLDDDHMFIIFGDPPAPPPPPQPPVSQFAILDIQQILTATGFRIIVTTNIPCHLHMLWTTSPYRKHTRKSIVRGLARKDNIQYCFPSYHDNVQEEAGDTLQHTFIKEPWPYCETRVFTFRALVNNEYSPSAGPIFKKHRAPFQFKTLVYEEWTS